MDWTPLSLKTLITQIPKVVNDNFTATERYLDVFYDENRQVIIKPVNTTGRVKGATGQFVNTITDNLTVKNQFTNLYENYTTVDSDFVTYFTGSTVTTRLATSDPSSASYVDSSTLVWPFEPSTYSWVDVQTPYIKISNDVSYGFQNDNLGQEFRLLFDGSGASPFTILLESSTGGEINLSVTAADASATWIKLITTAYDVSNGPTWTVKEYGGTYTIS